MSCTRYFGDVDFVEVIAHHSVASVGFELGLLSIAEMTNGEEVEVFAILVELQVELLKRCRAIGEIAIFSIDFRGIGFEALGHL